jgi:hypothetical protein
MVQTADRRNGSALPPRPSGRARPGLVVIPDDPRIDHGPLALANNPTKYGITNTTSACQGSPPCPDPDSTSITLMPIHLTWLTTSSATSFSPKSWLPSLVPSRPPGECCCWASSAWDLRLGGRGARSHSTDCKIEKPGRCAVMVASPHNGIGDRLSRSERLPHRDNNPMQANSWLC